MKAFASGMSIVLTISLLAGCDSSTSDAPDLQAEKAKALKLSDPIARSRKLVTVADRQRKVGDVLGAKATLVAAADAAEQIEDVSSKAGCLVQVASSLLRGGDLIDGKETLKRGEKAAEEIADPASKAGVYAELAAAYHTESPEKATYLLGIAQEEAEKITDPEQKGIALIRLGNALLKVEEKEAAQKVVDQAAELARSLEDMRRRSDGLTDAAMLAVKLDAAQGEKLLAEADQAADGADAPYTKGHAHVSIAKKLLAAGMKTEAKSHVDKASTLTDKVTDGSLRTELMDQVNKLKRSL